MSRVPRALVTRIVLGSRQCIQRNVWNLPWLACVPPKYSSVSVSIQKQGSGWPGTVVIEFQMSRVQRRWRRDKTCETWIYRDERGESFGGVGGGGATAREQTQEQDACRHVQRKAGAPLLPTS